MKRIFLFLLASVLTYGALAQNHTLRLAPLFTTNMVFQQGTDAPVWGWGIPGTGITVHSSWGSEARTLVNPDGTWNVFLRTQAAGGPYEVDVRAVDTTAALLNVMVGEVWLCSGQSNMEMPLVGWPPADTVLTGTQTIMNSSVPDIRLFSVPLTASTDPEITCGGTWMESSPTSTPSFSATAYFFGKQLHDVLKAPIGLIHSRWGGTPIEAWMKEAFLTRVAGYDSVLRLLHAARDGVPALAKWRQEFPTIDMKSRMGEKRWQNLNFGDDRCADVVFNDSSWHDMVLPTYWEAAGLDGFDGVVWFRKRLAIPPEWVHKDLVLDLGPVDDIDVTFVNGVKVGSHEGEGMYSVNRVYPIPKEMVDTTFVQVAVRVIDYQGGGGICGGKTPFSLHPAGAPHDSVSLAGSWKFLPVAEYSTGRLFVFGVVGEKYYTHPFMPIIPSGSTPTALYNAMIAPLAPFAIRGAIWYQGEANVGNPQEYGKLLPLLIENWRDSFRDTTMSFYYVQIAPYVYDTLSQSQLLRESQAKTLSVAHTGMAVTLDIGNFTNIHPANKPEVGRRLALCALAKTYGRRVAYSGPVLRSVKQGTTRMVLTFAHVRRGLVIRPTQRGSGFQIAGADRVFKNADVRVQDSTLIVSNATIMHPQSVRYGFSNTPDATFFNGDGLPSTSFRTDDW